MIARVRTFVAIAGLAIAVVNLSCGGRRADDSKEDLDDTSAYVVAEPASNVAGARSAAADVRHAYSHARVEVRADVARTVITDVFVNDADAERSFSYRFPLPNDGTVAGLAEYHDGARVEAAIGGKDDARKEFDRAAAEGKKAGLAEADGASGFRMALTPLAPHESRRVELTYVQTLRPLGGERTFVYPAGYSGDGPAGAFEVDVRLTATRPITALETPNTDDARVVRGRDVRARASLERIGAGLERDFVVRWSESSLPLGLSVRAVRTKADEPAYVEAQVAFTKDPYADAIATRDVVFVVDTSLSMAGQALADATRVVERSAQNLAPSDRIALVTFDGVVRSWPALTPASDATRKRLVDELHATRAAGTSNLDAAIDRAHELLAPAPLGIVVIATDGQPTVGADLDKLTPATPRDGFKGMQAFVALFNYPSRQKPLEELFPNVTTVYVPSGDASTTAIRRVADLVSAPTIEDVHVVADGLAPETTHGKVPERLSMGDGVRIVGRATGAVTVRMTGTLHGKPIALTQRLDAPGVTADGDPLPTEWARLRIADLETRFRAAPDDAIRQEITALGTSYHLVSSMTSLVAASDSLSPDRIMPGDPEIRVRAPRGANGVRAVLPWGETIECEWNDDEGLWFGRFLVPRDTPDALYRVRVLVDFQGQTSVRTTLLFRVDSKPPELALTATRDREHVRFEARAVRDVFDGQGNSLRKDLVDVKSVVVRIGATAMPMERSTEDTWTAIIDVPASGAVQAELVATDFARNTRTTSTTIELAP